MADHAAARARLSALREEIARLEGRVQPGFAAPAGMAPQNPDAVADVGGVLPFGVEILDAAPLGGLPLDGLTEIRTDRQSDAGAASGLALALCARLLSAKSFAGLPLLWIGDAGMGREAGFVYGPGLAQFGIAPQAMLQAFPRRLEDGLWLAEAALESAGFAMVVVEMAGNPRGFGLSESRRLQLRAKAAGRPLILLRHGGDAEAGSARLRFCVAPAASAERCLPGGIRLAGSVGHPLFRLTVEKGRHPPLPCLLLEFDPHVCQFRLHQPALAGNRPGASPAAHSGGGLSASFDGQDLPKAVGGGLALKRA